MTPRTVHLLPETETRIRELLPLYKLENEPWATARDIMISIAVRRLWNDENPRTHEIAHARANKRLTDQEIKEYTGHEPF